MFETSNKYKQRKPMPRLTIWVKCALSFVVVLYFLIVMNDSYLPGDLYSPVEVTRREVFSGPPLSGDLFYFAFHILFYMYQIGLVYKFATGDYRENDGNDRGSNS